ncbi:Veg family protein [uncultured Fretibacterium sp.]|uniref:Veg family protein n=1 Tax=uncultured Fretibacterium sp. TaxID=1678694 RepID=UPI00262765DB|nr:Veg family protein [uncultured Fretibacterium sp.]
MPRTLTSIKDEIFSYKGRLVRCRMSKGRNRTEETEGILLDVYPKLFTLYDESSASTVSFSYAEILTREVELEIVTRV